MRIIVLCCFILSAPVLAQTPCEGAPPADQGGCDYYPHEIVYAQTDSKMTVSWAPDIDPTVQARLTHDVETRTWPGGLTVDTVTVAKGVSGLTWQPQRAGFYELRVRACDKGTPAGQVQCSTWATILDRQFTINDASWVVYLKLAKPSGGGIE